MSLFVVCCRVLVVLGGSLFVGLYLLWVWCLSFVVVCSVLLFVVCCVLFVVCLLLFGVLVFVVC